MNHELGIMVSGRVIHGDHYGRALGFPTANIDRRQYARNGTKVRLGIWAGIAKFQISNFKFQMYRSAIVIGPVDKKSLPKIEAHLIGFKGNLYGKKISLSLQKYIRPFKKFKNEDELKRQIGKDIRLISKSEMRNPKKSKIIN
jgi:riboflavin kinase/FMN adenylyltransferase